MNLPSLKGLRAVEAAARLGSFTRAAEELNVTQTAISRLVREVELWLGQTLFERQANGLALSEAGRAFGPRLSDAFRDIEAAVASLKRRSGGPAITVAVGPTFAMRWLIPRLPGFHRSHPGTEVRIVTAVGDPQELRPDWTASIRLAAGPGAGQAGRQLFKAALFPVAAPAVAAQLRKPADLARHTLLEVEHSPQDWPRWMAAAGVDPARLRRRLSFDYSAFALQATLDGLGVALARAPYVGDDLAAQRLVKVFDVTLEDDSRGWYLMHRPGAERDPAFAAFIEWLEQVVTPNPAAA
jgi:LysR family glycine cleavage system transcriptional activator/LysR family transcriptional regulator of beta-lactamase